MVKGIEWTGEMPFEIERISITPDGFDVRFTLRTDDDALIYCEYSGRVDMAAGRAISAPLFQCGDERYDWINRSQFIGDGTVDVSATGWPTRLCCST